jgi:hypothetical protein
MRNFARAITGSVSAKLLIAAVVSLICGATDVGGGMGKDFSACV